MKRRTVVFTEEAGADLDWIYDAIATAASPITAAQYAQRIQNFCSRLSLASNRGTVRNEIRPGLRVVGFERRVTIAFVVEPDRVVILRIFYGGANWESELDRD